MENLCVYSELRTEYLWYSCFNSLENFNRVNFFPVIISTAPLHHYKYLLLLLVIILPTLPLPYFLQLLLSLFRHRRRVYLAICASVSDIHIIRLVIICACFTKTRYWTPDRREAFTAVFRLTT